ncbi:unnamed protein product [Rhizopus microsporus]|uniref:SPX domain-containing protein n=1 Tax=Rhizopus microsporus TaxID=58291 RepID=A0A1X0SD59_RHIZD|nr:hypothetical protein BCV71DRAFT_193448 [Rhizopus microsporus]
MKFSAEFNTRIKEPWRDSYMEYASLNNLLKAKTADEWDEQCESEFNACFLTELEKVYCFVQTHLDGLVKRINNFGKILEGKSDFMMNIKYEAIADDIAETLIDVDELAKFHSLNVEAFERIAKRHSRYAERIQQAFNFENALAIYPLYNQRFDPLFVLLSEMYNLCKRKGEPEVMDKVADEPDQVEFERETKKYWIHPDHIAEVKAIILLHLPVHVQSQGKSYKATDAAVSSVYYDNKSFDMYKQKLIQKKGSEIVRVRWYGKCDSLSDDVYVEKKTHRAEWLEGKSVKGRIKIKGQQVNDVMNGRYSAEEYEDEMKNKGILDKEIIERRLFIARGIQSLVMNRKLQPICRIFYNRLAFQLPNDQRLRICIDSNLTFIREDHLDGKQRRLQDSWRRTDVDINYPFLNVDENDILRFPYAILEVKVQNHLGQEIPSWLSRLLNSDIVHEVPDFSKYLHGVSHFFKDMVNELPPWLSQLDQNIRKPASSRDGITRSQSFKALFNGRHRRSLMQNDEKNSSGSLKIQVEESLFKERLESINWGFDNTNRRGRFDAPISSRVLINRENRIHGQLVDIPEKTELTDESDIASRRTFVSRMVQRYKERRKKEKSDEENPSSAGPSAPVRTMTRYSFFHPERQDPKVFFANERTFLTWLQFCAVLLTIALKLLNTGDGITRIVGTVFLSLSAFLSMYALARFHFRAFRLQTGRTDLRLDDIYGPGVLCALLVTALAFNFYVRIPLLFSEERTRILPNPY